MRAAGSAERGPPRRQPLRAAGEGAVHAPPRAAQATVGAVTADPAEVELQLDSSQALVLEDARVQVLDDDTRSGLDDAPTDLFAEDPAPRTP